MYLSLKLLTNRIIKTRSMYELKHKVFLPLSKINVISSFQVSVKQLRYR